MKTVKVAAAIIKRSDKILISKRQTGQHLAGFWEFPGGKVECDETPEQALFRELLEELNITANKAEKFDLITFQYPEKTVELHFFLVEQFFGQEKSNEGQEIKWVNISELKASDFPEANQPVVAKLLKGMM